MALSAKSRFLTLNRLVMNLPDDFINELYHYLSTKPYAEVAGFLKFLESEKHKQSKSEVTKPAE